MTALLSALYGAESVFLAATRIWGVAIELLTATALLWAPDTFALVRLPEQQSKATSRKQHEEGTC